MYIKKQTHNVDMEMLHLIVDNLGVDIFLPFFNMENVKIGEVYMKFHAYIDTMIQ